VSNETGIRRWANQGAVARPVQSNATSARARTMLSDRGSLNPDRGYKPENPSDIYLENCGTCFLVQGRTAKGRALIEKALENSTLLFFAGDLVLNYQKASLLLELAKRYGVKLRILNYAAELEISC
jgi:hypothetical protein